MIRSGPCTPTTFAASWARSAASTASARPSPWRQREYRERSRRASPRTCWSSAPREFALPVAIDRADLRAAARLSRARGGAVRRAGARRPHRRSPWRPAARAHLPRARAADHRLPGILRSTSACSIRPTSSRSSRSSASASARPGCGDPIFETYAEIVRRRAARRARAFLSELSRVHAREDRDLAPEGAVADRSVEMDDAGARLSPARRQPHRAMRMPEPEAAARGIQRHRAARRSSRRRGSCGSPRRTGSRC